MKTLALAALAALTLAPAALAQTAAPQWMEIEDDAMMVPGLALSVDAIEDLDLFDAQGTKIGEVEEVLGDGAGAVLALSIEPEDAYEVAGDDDDFVIGLDQVTLENNRLVTTLDREAILALPRWND